MKKTFVSMFLVLLSNRASENASGTHRNTFRFGRPAKNYLNNMCARDTTPCQNYQIYDLFYLQFKFLHSTQMDVNNQTQKVNLTKCFTRFTTTSLSNNVSTVGILS